MYFPPQGKTDLLPRERKPSGKFGAIIVKDLWPVKQEVNHELEYQYSA
jgi:hypothetical protein